MELKRSQNTSRRIQQLPGQYANVLGKPSIHTFVEEKQKASWGSVWIQLIGLGIVSAILQSIDYLISSTALHSITGTSEISATGLIVTLAIAQIILIPLSFFIAIGILYLIAKAFGGQGSYLEQLYTTVLFGVPLVALSYLLLLVPVAGNWLVYLPHVYSLILFAISLMAVQRLSLGKAIAVILIPIAALLLLTIAIVVVLIAALH